MAGPHERRGVAGERRTGAVQRSTPAVAAVDAGTSRPGLGNAVLAAATTAALGLRRPPAVEDTVQRAPDPAKVAAAAAQATEATADAQLLRAIQVMPPLPGQFGAAGLLLRAVAQAGVPIGLDAAGSGAATTAHLFVGKVPEVALVVAGVHGSEQSGVEVAERLLVQLQTMQPHFTVVVVPRLFPANVASRAAWEDKLAKAQSGIAVAKYQQLRNAANDPGRSTPGEMDPNRQFPDVGKDLDLTKPLDAKGRIVEPSNIALMALIEAFKPSRIVSVHAIKDLGQAGIFADPHPSTAAAGDPQAQAADALALTMAKRADALGVNTRGNRRGTAWTSLYPGQDKALSAKQMKVEAARGRSLGQWAPSRGMTVVTVEVAEQHRSASAVADPGRAAELEAEATVIREIFLGPPPPAPAPVPAAPGAATPAVQPSAVQPGAVQRLLVRGAGAAGNDAAAWLVERLRR
ncbi:hypothetical protein AB6N24_16390 [Cellulomonas sp. 179-A 4D5 NHS]|uniref:hypothetical protein n=1 Tax=Cellulomonas sp. 179-A 4D5 NHS TaxID=3142378 RepID=UPI0039A29A87